MSVATITQNSVVDAANSSVVPLGAAGTFTGRREDVSIYAAVSLFVFTDQAGTLFIDFSVDGENWDKTTSFAVVASTANNQSVAPQAQYARVRFTNGATPQTLFRLQTFYQPVAPAASASSLGTVTADQGMAGAVAGAWPVKITDGVDTALVSAAGALVVDGSAVTQPVSVASLPLPAGAATSANQTTLGSQTSKINDGTNTATVKAASTAAVATDTALVVAISPNNPIVASNPSVGATGAAIPASATQVGGSDGTDLQAARVFDTDTGGGTQYVLGATLRKSASGGSVEAGTAADPLRTDPTGTTTQPVSDAGGSLTVDSLQLPAALVGARLDVNAGAWLGSTAPTVGSKTSANSVPVVIASDQGAVAVSAAALPLPSGAATEATLATRLADATFTGRINTLGQKAMAASTPIVIASDQSAVPISAASLPLPAGAATEATLATRATEATLASVLTQLDVALSTRAPDRTTAVAPFSQRLSDGAAFYDAAKTGQLPAALSGGRLDVVVGAALPAGANNIGDVDVLSVPAPLSTAGGGTEATALRVTVADDSTGLLSVDDNGASLTVDSPQLPAALVGGRLDVVVGAALPAGSNNIGDVDVLSVPAPLSTTGGGTEATALRVTVANDSTGVLSVDDNGSSLTVDSPQLPAALVGARLDVNAGAWLGSTAPTVGSKTSANSVPVVIASDQGAVPVSGTVTATNPSVGTNNAAIPASSTQIGGSDGTDLQAARVFDADTGAGSQYVLGVGLRKAASGGSVEAGTAADPLRTDPTGTTTQPVSDAGGSLTVDSLQLPAALVGARLDVNAGAWLGSTAPTVGSKTSANSVPVVIASDQGAVAISAASLPLPSGAAQEHVTAGSPHSVRLSDGAAFYDGTKTGQLPAALSGGRLDVVVGAALPAGTNNIGDVDVLTVPAPLSTAGGGTEATALRVTVANDSTGLLSIDDNGASLTVDTPQLPAALVGARLDVNNGAWLGSTAPTVGQKTAANSLPAVLASDQGALPVNVVGSHANAWNAAAVGANGTSTVIDCQYVSKISAFGNTSGNTTITVQESQDNTNFYDALALAGVNGDFGIQLVSGARYLRLKSSAARTITATIAGKS